MLIFVVYVIFFLNVIIIVHDIICKTKHLDKTGRLIEYSEFLFGSLLYSGIEIQCVWRENAFFLIPKQRLVQVLKVN